MTPDSVQRRFIYFIEERENVRVLRHEMGESAPFTQDKILQEFRFCNINREHDAVTLWIADHVRNNVEFDSPLHLICAMMACRIFNKPETLKMMDFSRFDIPSWFREAYQLQEEGHKILRGAYMMPAHGKNAKGLGVVDYYQRITMELSTYPELQEASTLAEVAECMTNVRGLGLFLANQVITDLRYTPQFKDASDWSTFILCGPGTRRGINRYDGFDKDKPRKPEQFSQRLLEIRASITEDISLVLEEYFMDPNNVSNSFCEFDKYERALEALSLYKQPRLRLWK